MRFVTTRRSVVRHAFPSLRIALAAGALFLALPAVPTAYASIGGCRSDPVFVLSDGTELDVSATIDTTSDLVQNVTYTLYIPAGTQVVGYAAGSLGARQQWSAVADLPAQQYETVTRVTTATAGVAVSATTQALGPLGSAAGTAQGQNAQKLVVDVAL